VDSDYTGEIFVMMHTIKNKPQFVRMGQKIAQLVIIPFIATDKYLVSYFCSGVTHLGEGPV
jgi:dUTPase